MESVHEEIHQLQMKITALQVQHWQEEFFLTPRWWLKLGMLIIPFVLWWVLVDKKRLSLVLNFALFVALIDVLLDNMGVNLGLWSYPRRLNPIWTGMISGEVSVTASLLSLMYQYFPRWRGYATAIVLSGGFLAFVGEPLLKWLGFYTMYRWNYGYSFLVYFAVALFTKWLVDKIAAT